MLRVALLFLFLYSSASLVKAQQIFLPLNRQLILPVDQYINQQDRRLHTSSRPLTTFFTGVDRGEYEHILGLKKRKTWLGRKLKSENFVQLKTDDFFLTIDPLVDFSIVQDDFTAYRTYQNTRGIIFSGEVNQSVYFFTSFYENQAFFPQFLSRYVQANDVVPGNGRVKPFKTDGFDYSMASAMISFDLFEKLNVQFGHHKNFIGDGYRSLFLSDNAFNYPHLKLSYLSTNGRWLYQSIYASLINLNRLPATTSSEAQFERKAGTFHFLNYLPSNWLSIGLFEGVIWQTREAEGTLPFNANILNPILFFNSSVNGFDTHRTQNQLGLNLKVKPFNNNVVYAQYLVGGFGVAQQGYQVGWKWYNALGIKNLDFQAEFNEVNQALGQGVAPESYAHYQHSLSFVPITTPQEFLLFLDYQWSDFFISGKASIGGDAPGGLNRRVVNGQVGYIVNPITWLNISVGFFQRQATIDVLDPFGNANWLTLNLSTRLHNRYFDF